jgi:hypothetical protein
MTDAEVAIYSKLFFYLPAKCTVPEIEESAVFWLEPLIISSFKDYFRTTTFAAEEPNRLYRNILPQEYQTPILGDRNKCAWTMLTRMLRRDVKTEIDKFLCLHRKAQIVLLELTAGISVLDQNICYLFFMKCIDKFHEIRNSVNIITSGATLDAGIVSNLLYGKNLLTGFKSKEVFQKLAGLGLDPTSCIANVGTVTDSAVMTDMLLGDAFKTFAALEEAFTLQKNVEKQRRY